MKEPYSIVFLQSCMFKLEVFLRLVRKEYSNKHSSMKKLSWQEVTRWMELNSGPAKTNPFSG